MKRMNYSSITAMLRRIHRAKSISDDTGIPVKELMERDRELRKQLQREREVTRQRRDFLKSAGGLGIGAGMLAVNPGAFAAGGGSQPSIAIVGGGSGGLRTAHRLMQYGISSTIYEGSDRVGGRMYSDRSFFSDNRVVEYGGEFISSEHTAIRNLAHQLGLKLEDANKLSLGDEETYLINNQLYSESDLMDEWAGGLYNTMKQAQKDAPWQPFYNAYNAKHLEYDTKNAIDWMANDLDYPSSHWVHKLLLTDLVSEYGITDTNSALNLIYLLAWNTHNSGGLPLAGTDERLHVVGGNDLIPLTMAAQLPSGSIEMEKKLVQIVGDVDGPYTLHFEDLSSATCEVLVLSLPINLIKSIDIDPRIWNAFSPQKQMAFNQTPLENISDNGKVMLEFSDRFWDRSTTIHGQEVHQAARAYSDPDKFISTWEGEPGNPSLLGVMVDYNGGYEARNLASYTQNGTLHGVAAQDDVDRFLAQAQKIWGNDGPNGTDIWSKWTGKALVTTWINDPFQRSAFTSPAVGTMTSWWGGQWEPPTNGSNIYFAGEAYDTEYWSYMNGAILSGERVAKEIHQNY
jgi:monoamine oxidase